MLTLEQLQAMSDKQLREELATKVMGWKRCTDRTYEWLNPDGTWNRDDDEFWPLTDWNHTIEVVDRVRNSGKPVYIIFNAEGQGPGMCDCGLLTDQVADVDMQRAICISSLLAVQRPS